MKFKNPKKKQEMDLERKRKSLTGKKKGSIGEEKDEPERFEKIREKEFPKSHRTKG